jgi:hypothetical protein
MQHIETRTHLLEYALARVLSNACRRAFDDGQVVNLGGFDPLPPSEYPGWLLRVTSKHGRVWLIAVTVEGLHRYRVWPADAIPWQFWTGKDNRDGGSIYTGDLPAVASTSKWRALNEGLPDKP